MDGRSFLKAMERGDVAPPAVAEVLGMRLKAVGENWVEFTMTAQTHMLNLLGTLHGGALAVLVDSALTGAVITQLPKGKACTSLDFQIRFFRPVRPSGDVLTARGTLVNLGRTVAATEASVTNGAGKIVAHATSSLAILDAQDLMRERRA
ncbi:MAG: PaaI family thioesterase [Candidatus Eremiobacteraeota bacterium]|nr:PaaI family thioesterase [Candidatus Eremiobacteraeota bacterium]